MNPLQPRLILVGYSLATSVTATFSSAAMAAEDPTDDKRYGVSVAETIQRDDNLFRLSSPTLLPGQNSRADTINRTELSAFGILKPERQRLHAGMTLDSDRYLHNDFLDNNSLSGDLTWDWQLGNYWSGTVAADQRQQLRSYADLSTAEKDVNTTRNGVLGIRYWLHPDWALGFNARQVSSRYSAAVSDTLEYDETWYEGGVTFRRANGNQVEAVLQHIDGSYVHPSTSSGYTQDGVLLRGDWAITEISELEGYVAASRRTYSDSQTRDFKGWLWRAAYHWRPTVKLQFDAVARRELGGQQDLVDNRVITEATSLAATWKATEKIRTSYVVEWLHRDYVVLSSQNEAIRSQRIELTYMPKDYFDVGVSVGREGRRSLAEQRNYDDDVVSLTARLKM